MKRDSQILSIMNKIVAPKQISASVDDIKFARNIKNITFSYCNKIATTLADRIMREMRI